jgi:hypothetical protein
VAGSALIVVDASCSSPCAADRLFNTLHVMWLACSPPLIVDDAGSHPSNAAAPCENTVDASDDVGDDEFD